MSCCTQRCWSVHAAQHLRCACQRWYSGSVMTAGWYVSNAVCQAGPDCGTAAVRRLNVVQTSLHNCTAVLLGVPSPQLAYGISGLHTDIALIAFPLLYWFWASHLLSGAQAVTASIERRNQTARQNKTTL